MPLIENVEKFLKGLSSAALKELVKQSLNLLSIDDGLSVVQEWVDKNELHDEVARQNPNEEEK